MIDFGGKMIEIDPLDDKTMERRDLLKSTGTVAAWLATSTELSAEQVRDDRVPEAHPGPLLPTVPFGKQQVTRLIAGANPVYGYSHFNYVFSATMGEYHTSGRVLSFLRELERAGINTWQASWNERFEAQWLQYKEQGGKLQLIVLSRPSFNEEPEMLGRVMRLKPLGIVQHGSVAQKLWVAGKLDRSLDYLKRIRQTGAMVGLSCAVPQVAEYIEDKGWDLDFYMTGVYNIDRSRAEFEKILGELPYGEIYLASDPPKMMAVMRKAKRTCLAYKVLAAGRLVRSPEQVREHLAAIYSGIKPNDAVIVGLYQRFNDQIGQTAQFVREILAKG